MCVPSDLIVTLETFLIIFLSFLGAISILVFALWFAKQVEKL